MTYVQLGKRCLAETSFDQVEVPHEPLPIAQNRVPSCWPLKTYCIPLPKQAAIHLKNARCQLGPTTTHP
jgi:hypothetical protein